MWPVRSAWWFERIRTSCRTQRKSSRGSACRTVGNQRDGEPILAGDHIRRRIKRADSRGGFAYPVLGRERVVSRFEIWANCFKSKASFFGMSVGTWKNGCKRRCCATYSRTLRSPMATGGLRFTVVFPIKKGKPRAQP